MNSRERFLAAANHTEPDRVPLDFGVTRSGGITAVAYNALTQFMGIDNGPARIYDIQQQLAWPDESLLEQFGVDVFDIGRAFLTEPADWTPVTLKDGSAGLIPAYHHHRIEADGTEILSSAKGTPVAIKPTSSFYFDQHTWPWNELSGIPDPIEPADFDEEIWAIPASPNHLDYMTNDAAIESLSAAAKHLYETTDQALYVDFGRAGFFEKGFYMRGAENWLVEMMIDRAGAERMLDAYVESCLARLERLLPAVGPYIQVIRLFHDDLGSQTGPQFSPELFKDMMVPRYRTLCDFIHARSECKILSHSCGSILPMIEHFVDAGVDMLNPIQIGAQNMDPTTLKKTFGDHIVFWGGGCDTVAELEQGTPEQVRDKVKEHIETFAPGGGFVFVHTHNIQPGVPPENVLAMLDAVREFGGY
jgi:uroporphyrinogen decarboxylase